jgi:hypothetical protein
MEPNAENTAIDRVCALVYPNVISNPSTARQISDIMLEFTKQLEESTELVRTTCSVAEWKAYKKAAATIYGEMFLSLLEPLYKKHPSLKPPGWDNRNEEDA